MCDSLPCPTHGTCTLNCGLLYTTERAGQVANLACRLTYFVLPAIKRPGEVFSGEDEAVHKFVTIVINLREMVDLRRLASLLQERLSHDSVQNSEIYASRMLA